MILGSLRNDLNNDNLNSSCKSIQYFKVFYDLIYYGLISFEICRKDNYL